MTLPFDRAIRSTMHDLPRMWFGSPRRSAFVAREDPSFRVEPV